MALGNNLVIIFLSVVLLLIAFYGHKLEKRLSQIHTGNEVKEELTKEQINAHRKEFEEQISVLQEPDKVYMKENDETRENKAAFFSETATCGSKWIQQFETNEKGNVVSGSDETFRQAVLSGAKVRISLNGYYPVTEVIYVNNMSICVQAYIHTHEILNNRPTAAVRTQTMITVCTNPNPNPNPLHFILMPLIVDFYDQPIYRDFTLQFKVKWLTRQRNHPTPIFCSNTSSGSADCSNIKNLISAVSNGAELYTLGKIDEPHMYGVFLSQVLIDEAHTVVSGISTVQITDLKNYKNYTHYATLALLLMFSTDGTINVSYMNHIEILKQHSHSSIESSWFADTCWKLAYEHDKHGQAIEGSLECLRSAILVGKRVRLFYSDTRYGIEANQLLIRNGHVTAHVLSHVLTDNQEKIQDNAIWNWQNVATTGNVESIRYNISSHTSFGSSSDRHAVKWFIDSTPWEHAYSNSETGTTTHGSKASLIQEVNAGKLIRFAIRSANQQGNDYIAIFNADRANLSQVENDLSAHHTRSIRLRRDGLYNVVFGSEIVWNHMIATTTGQVDDKRRTVGGQKNQEHITYNSAIDWFVS
ncbi:uncharacterized protein LOC134721735 [Mytilus trossulus]|uniref:uncharacterized protein LOC134721735 n=1 Tax=Mytilus trossulus TaxID=6551 RepID=UPI0030043249